MYFLNMLDCCLGCCYGCCCCEFNFAIFPAPSPSYSMKESSYTFFINSKNERVPYLELITDNPKFHMIYFHGNAEDIGYSAEILFPIQQKVNVNIYAIEYPCYGAYERNFGARISNDIKANAIEFYRYLSEFRGLTQKNTIVMGRSIGSGGACYLANRERIQNLILVSPFSTISSVAKDFVSFLGCIVKNHFHNIQQIRTYQGKLLVIHGKVDEVIGFRHGEELVAEYEEEGRKCTFITPPNMSHNQFSLEFDIVQPIRNFVQKLE